MKKKAVTLAISALLCGAALTAGTLAFLTDTDAAKNVMTLGTVEIVQTEYERAVNDKGEYVTDGNSFVLKKGFTQGKGLYPIVGDPNGVPSGSGWPTAGWLDSPVVDFTQDTVGSAGTQKVFAGKNAQDKFVTVTNTGRSDAYVRTLVALEIGDTTDPLLGYSYYDLAWTVNVLEESITLTNAAGNETTYCVLEFVYTGRDSRHPGGVLPSGQVTYPSLCQVYIKSVATNEDMIDLDANGTGSLEVLVLSQAAQVEGFANAEQALNTAFGETTPENAAKWFANLA